MIGAANAERRRATIPGVASTIIESATAETLKHSFSKIDKIGIELEGAWDSGHEVSPHIHRDGSVTGFPSSVLVGEYSSEPLGSFKTAVQNLLKYYPNYVNHTCGFHVHLSFSVLNYSRLMDPAFNDLFLQRMEEFCRAHASEPGFDRLRERLDGQNIYCRKIFRPEEQLWRMEPYDSAHSLPRYSQLNFCFGRHQTMECRLFPCFPNAHHAVQAMETFIRACHDYISRCPSEKKISEVIRVAKVSKLPALPPL